jgi:hypothetical protein
LGEKKKRSGDCEWVWLVSERPSRINRANSLNPDGVKVPAHSQPSQSLSGLRIKWRGAYGIRTRDLLNAIEALYQLS